MAAVVAKPAAPATKMKKPPPPLVQTNINGGRPSAPSASPSTVPKALPGQSATPTTATSNSATTTTANGTGPARPNRRLQRLTTRNNASEGTSADKKSSKKFPEPYVPKESHILRKYKGCAPSLIVHLHPTHFRFDQQDGSFSYHSEMRIFIEHLQKGTIPHDMVEEFRKSEVKYYEGWLIVRVVDHKSAAKEVAANGAAADDEKLFSIHNYNQYITPSPYAPYPPKEQPVARSPPMKHEQKDSVSSQDPNNLSSTDTIDVAPKSTKPQPKIYHVALRPTILSKHMDLVIDAMAPDPKSINRKQSQANVNSRASGSGAPQTPISGMPQTPSTEKGPPLKKQKLKIDPKDILDYEARVVNATAPPLYLDPVESLEEVDSLISMLKDPYHDARPPSPKSRKRTVAELAAEDAHAKEQERFMLIMDERTANAANAANAGNVDGQAAAGLFQPRFEKFNALDGIKRDIAERKQREKERQLQEDENRRGQQQEKLQEEEKKRIMMQRAQEARMLRARQQEMQAYAAQQQQQQQQGQQQPQVPNPGQVAQRPPSQQMNGIPPNIQNQMMAAAAQQRGSPIIRQGTPHAASSPVVTSAAQGAQPMAVSTSQQGHGSPARPGSAVQHAHPTSAMTRVPSNQGQPSRNGTPQLTHGTPAARNATPILRQGTPSQHMTQASPHGSMAAPTPQMMQAAMMQGQMVNGGSQPMNPQQVAQMQRRHHAMQQQAAMSQAGLVNGTPQMAQAQMAHLQAQHHAQVDRQAAIQRQQAQQAQQQREQQQQAMQQGTPQSQHMSPAPQTTKAYNASLAESMKAQMQNLQQGQVNASPAQNHMTPQQQAAQAQMAHVQQQQQQQRMMAAQAQGQMMAAGMQQQQQQQQQQRPSGLGPYLQQVYNSTLQAYQARFMTQAAAKYQGNTNMLQPNEIHQISLQARQAAVAAVRKQQAAQAQAAQAAQAGQNPAQQNAMNMNAMQMQQAQLARQQAAQQAGAMQNGMGGMNMNPNMAQAIQQQNAQQMQQLQMQHAQAQMIAAQQHQQQQQQGMQFPQQR